MGSVWKSVGRSKARDIESCGILPFAKNAKDGAPDGQGLSAFYEDSAGDRDGPCVLRLGVQNA